MRHASSAVHSQNSLLIFDLDGTLVDSRADLAAGINHMRSGFGLEPLPLEVISGYIGGGVRNLVERSLQGADAPFEEALNAHKRYYNANLAVHTTTYPGVCGGIQALVNAGYTLALLSNKPGDASRAILEHFGLSEHFAVMIGGGDGHRLKPEPDGIHVILEETGVPAERAWMIGDHHTDLVVARNAGIRSGYVGYGFGDPRDFSADVSFETFEQLVRFFT